MHVPISHVFVTAMIKMPVCKITPFNVIYKPGAPAHCKELADEAYKKVSSVPYWLSRNYLRVCLYVCLYVCPQKFLSFSPLRGFSTC